MATVRYDKKVLRRLRYHTLFILSPPVGNEQYEVGLQRAHDKIRAFYTYVNKWLSDDAYGGRTVPYNMPQTDKYKYLVYQDLYSKTKWGIVYEDMGQLRIVRMLELERFYASRYGLRKVIKESQLRRIIQESLKRLFYN